MLPSLKTPGIWENYYKAFIDYFRSDLLSLYRKNWKREDYYEFSNIQYVISQYWYALYLVTLIKYEMLQGVNTSWSYYIDKYNLEDKRKKLACNNVSLKKILELFELPTSTTTVDETNSFEGIGIENDIIQNDLIIEPSTNTEEELETIDIQYYIDNPKICNNYLTNEVNTAVESVSVPTADDTPYVVTSPLTIYYGATIGVPNEAGILLLSSISQTTVEGTYAIAGAGYKVIAFPAALPQPNDFKDIATSLDVAMDRPINVTVNGEPYILYMSYYYLGGSLTIEVSI